MNKHDKINLILSGMSSRFYNSRWKLLTKILKCYYKLIGVTGMINVLFRGRCEIWRCLESTIRIGDNCTFNSSSRTNHIGLNHRCILSTVNAKAEIVLGDYVGMSSTSITAFKSVRIGNNVRIGANCVIMDGDFHLDDPRVGAPRDVVIEDNVWLGYGVIVQKGVTIGENSVIGMNSIVTHDIPANVVAAGMPAKVIKEIKP